MASSSRCASRRSGRPWRSWCSPALGRGTRDLVPGLLLAGLLLLGCALTIEPVGLEPHLSAPREAAPEGRLRLGVGLFVDDRPAVDRKELHPPLRWNGFGLERRGQVRTGDVSFRGEVAAGIRADVAATLARAEAFSSVRTVPVDAAAARRGRFPAKLDLVLTARILELGAVQFQDSGLDPLHGGWPWSRFSDPVGFARVLYRVHDHAGQARSYRIEIEHPSPGSAITVAAVDAMAASSESLAERLRADWLPESARRSRQVPVRVLDDCGLGQERVAGLLEQASRVFEREAGIRFGVSVERWSGPRTPADLEALLRDLRERVDAGDGIVLALVPGRRVRTSLLSREAFGLAVPFGQHAVVRCEPGGRVRMVTLIHELGHLFGAVHVPARRSVMHPVAGFDGRFFDPLNHRLLRAARERPFGAPLPGPLVRRLRALYRAAFRSPGSSEAADLESTLSALE